MAPIRSSIAAALAALTIAGGAPPAASAPLVLADATVHTVSGPTLERASILIRDGVIAEIGPRVSVPAGARVVPCAGKHVYPGFVSPNTVSGVLDTPARPNDPYDERYAVPAKLHRAGVAFCIGDDGGRDEAMSKPSSMASRQTRLFEKFDGRPRGKLARPRNGGAAAAEATEAPGR